MVIRWREGVRGLVLATLMTGAAVSGLACGGDDDNAGASSGTSGTSGTPFDSGTSDGSSGTSGGSSGTSGSPDAGPAIQAAAPVFSPVPGTFTSVQSVTITSATPDAEIFFTLNGTNPTTDSEVYTGPLGINRTTTIRAMATAKGFANSAVVPATYKIEIPIGEVHPPNIAPNTSLQANQVRVVITNQNPPSDGGVEPTICYTKDGATAPTCNADQCGATSATYNAGTDLFVDAPPGDGSAAKVKIRAIACTKEKASAEPAPVEYSFQTGTPEASRPTGDVVTYNTNVVISTATKTPVLPILCYTTGWPTNDAAPACNTTRTDCLTGTKVSGSDVSIAIKNNVKINVVACRENYANSEPATFTYEVAVDQPTLDESDDINDHQVVAAQPGNATIKIAADSPAPGAPAGKFCFTTGDAEPTCDTTVTPATCTGASTDTAPVVLATNTRVNVIACKPGYRASLPRSATYQLHVDPIDVSADGVALAADKTNHWKNGNDVTFLLSSLTKSSPTANANKSFIRYTVVDKAGAATDPTCDGDPSGIVAADDTAPNGNPAPGGGALDADQFPWEIRAIGCKTGYRPTAVRTLLFVDPTARQTLAFTADSGPNQTGPFKLGLQTSPTAAGFAANDGKPHICYTVGLNGQSPAEPNCNTVTGACVGVDTLQYNPSSRPTITTTGTTVRAISCTSGVALASNRVERSFTLKLGTVTVNTSPTSAANPIASPGTIPLGKQIYFHSKSESALKTVGACGVAGKLCFRYRLNSATPPTCNLPKEGADIDYDPAVGIQHLPKKATGDVYKVITCDGDNQSSPSDVFTFDYAATLDPIAIAPPPSGPKNNAYIPGELGPVVLSSVSATTTVGPSGGTASYICYSTDGAQPQCIGGGGCSTNRILSGGTAGTSALNIDQTGSVIRARVCRDGFLQSPMTPTAPYELVVAAPEIKPDDVTPQSSINVTIKNTATIGARVCWSYSPISDDCLTGGVLHCQDNVPANTSLTNVAELADRRANVTVHVRACRAGFASTDDIARTYTFTPYSRTITIDGNFDEGAPGGWIAIENGIGSETSGGGQMFLSWDADKIYVAWRGTDVSNNANRKFHFYVRGGSGLYTTLRDDHLGDDAFGDASDNPAFAGLGGVNHHYWVQTDRTTTGNGAAYAGASWDADASSAITCKHGGTLGAADALVECSIPRSEVGLAASNASLAIAGGLIENTTFRNRAPFSGGNWKYWGAPLDAAIPTVTSAVKP